ncbi:hypothetical protein, partial [Sphingopyxis alaskensis]|uniref:hypothetical protein n=1 Tax=Sphingopyxis alaskensis TaxID=117207 RepID=UPI00203DCF46
GHGSARHTNNRGGSAATDYTKGRLKMKPAGHTRIYTTLTDTTLACMGFLGRQPIRRCRLKESKEFPEMDILPSLIR